MKTYSYSSILAALILAASFILPCSLYLTGCVMAPAITAPDLAHPTHSDVPDCVPGASGEHIPATI